MLVTPEAAVWPMSSPPMEGGVLAGTSLPQAQLDNRGAGRGVGQNGIRASIGQGGELNGPSSLFLPVDVILYGVRCILPETTHMASQHLQQKHISSISALPCVCVPLCGWEYIRIDVLWLKANSYKRTDTITCRS